MLGSGFLRRIGRRIAAQVASRVAQDDLFEKPQERPPQSPVFSSAPAPAPAPPPTPPVPVPAAGRVQAALVGCAVVDLSTLRERLGPGGGLRLVNHWATWCDPCIEELPVLAMLHDLLGERVAFLGVSWDLFEGGGDPASTAREVAAFAVEQGIVYPSVLVNAAPEDFFAALDLRDFQKIPQTWVIDDAGRVLRRLEGVLDVAGAEDLAAFLREQQR